MEADTPSVRPEGDPRPRSTRGTIGRLRLRQGRLLALAVIGTVFVLFGSVVWFAWQESGEFRDGEAPLLRAETEPYKVPPEDPGGLPLVNADRPIGRVLQGESEPVEEPEQIVPVETPHVRTAVELLPPPAEADERVADEGALESLPTADRTAGPEIATGAGPALGESAADGDRLPRPLIAREPAGESALPPRADRTVVPPAATGIVAAPLPEPAAGSPGRPEEEGTGRAARSVVPPSSQDAPPAPAIVVAAPSPGSEAPPPPASSVPAAGSESGGALPQPKPAAESRPAAAAVTAALAPEQGGADVRLQLAAVSDAARAEAQWRRFRERFPAVLGGLRLVVEPLARDGNMLYRIQAAGFPDREAAADACAAIKRAGGDCFVVVR